MARLTAKLALRDVLALGWKSDAIATETAVRALISNGCDEQAARREVAAAIPAFQITGAV